ncbi:MULTISPECIES: hydrogenase [Thermococcus]|uniref:Hydrogenase n=1 Tax=Thermococcus aciditolerans TaxID=2598455 RepID=A0A5C0SPN3_9EURY|nr:MULTISPECIES: hydrogenase [Thermococcus]ASA78380.1 hydrogenase [Thermococcus sp. 5-4]QEK15148.1 hydrogenase [Thermococcus aciditolerans]
MTWIESLTLNSPSGFWNPIVWLALLIVFAVIGYVIYSRGNRSYKPNTDQVKPFLSGNEVEDVEEIRVRAGDIYWGFIEALKGYYNVLMRMHTGDVRDYILWYLGLGAIILFILVGGV